MSQPAPGASALLVVAAFSRHAAALDWATEKLQATFGPIDLTSPDYEFNQTRYYETTMGAGLRKKFFIFHHLVDAAFLAAAKLRAIDLEAELARQSLYAEPRPLNVDPGLLTLGKFMLATTKDQSHRIYLRDGIFGEVTLRFREGTFEAWPWTYADYRQPMVIQFLNDARDYYRRRLNEQAHG